MLACVQKTQVCLYSDNMFTKFAFRNIYDALRVA